MVYTLFITGDASITIFPKSDTANQILKTKRRIEEFEQSARLTWLSRIGSDNYIYLMLAVNAYTDKDIDNLRADLEEIARRFTSESSELHNFTAHTLAGVADFTIKGDRVFETRIL